jgi:hypothetical protein
MVTDGTIGVLAAANIVDWDLLLNDHTSTLEVFGSNSALNLVGNSFTATATELLFDFSGSGQVLFEKSIGTLADVFCFDTAGYGKQEEVKAAQADTLQFNSLLLETAVNATVSAPEPSTLLLLGGGLTIVGFAS